MHCTVYSDATDDKDTKQDGQDYYHSRNKWQDGLGDINRPYTHAREHEGHCVGSRQVSAAPTGSKPLNSQCPPAPHPAAEDCVVPATCAADSTNPLCPANEYKRFDVSEGKTQSGRCKLHRACGCT